MYLLCGIAAHWSVPDDNEWVCTCCVGLLHIGQYLMTMNGCVYLLCGVAADWSVPDDTATESGPLHCARQPRSDRGPAAQQAALHQ